MFCKIEQLFVTLSITFLLLKGDETKCRTILTFQQTEFSFINEASQKNDLYWDTEADFSATSGNANLCSGTGVKSTTDPIYIKCTAGSAKALVGYNVYGCDQTTSIFGGDLISNSKLAPYSECYGAIDGNVCADVSVMNSVSKLMINSPYHSDGVDKMNIFLLSYKSDKYKLKCGTGYDFQTDIDNNAVYGGCASKAGDMNTLTLDNQNSKTPVCYASCPAQFSSINIVGSVTNVKLVNVTTIGRRSGSTGDVEVTCDDGYDLAYNAVKKYSFSCSGNTADTASNGNWSCSTCPTCYAICTANPTAAQLGSTHTALGSVTLPESVSGKEMEGTPICTAGYALDISAAATYKFKCGTDGKFSCSGTVCPVCKGNCDWPEGSDSAAHVFIYLYVDGTAKKDGEKALPGENHVEAACKNTSLNIVGQRFLSCNDSKLTFAIANDTECKEVNICETPVISNAVINTMENILVDETYTVTCNSDSVLDMNSRRLANAYERIVRCRSPNSANESVYVIPPVLCHVGCDEIDFPNGNVMPSTVQSGSAPYRPGQTLSFECNEGMVLDSVSKTVECVPGQPISVPTCKMNSALSTTTSSMLLLSLVYSQLV